MPKAFFKKMSLDVGRIDLTAHARFALLQAKDDLLCGKSDEALAIVMKLLEATRDSD